MKQVFTFFLFWAFFGRSAFSQASSAVGNALHTSEPTKKQDQLIVQFLPGFTAPEFINNLNATCRFAKHIAIEKTLAEQQRIFLLSASQIIDRDAFFNFVKNSPEVQSASWNVAVQFRQNTPNDELFGEQWDMERIGAPLVWEVTTGGHTFNGHEIVVAVLDKGFEITHPDLLENIWQNPGETPNDGIDNDGNGYVDDVRGWNFRQGSPILPIERHGTGVSGIIGALGNNSIGTAGVNWNIKMIPLAIEYADEVVAAFNYVLKLRERYNQTNGEQGAFVVVTNGSFGIDGVRCEEQPGWGAMYDPLGQVGVLNVAATANEDWDVDEVGDIPTSCPSEFLIAVTNTDEDDDRAPGSAWGATHIDLGAPGQSTSTASTNGTYRNDFSGTSSACPHVSGSIALLYSVPCPSIDSLALTNPAEAARLMQKAILLNTDPIASLADETATGGRLNVYEGMKYLHAYCIAREPELAAGNFKEVYLGKKDLIRVMPNPTSSKIYIDYGNVDFKGVKIRVYNMLGQEMLFEQAATPEPFQPQSIEIDVTDWTVGVYVVNLFDLTRKISVKFVKF